MACYESVNLSIIPEEYLIMFYLRYIKKYVLFLSVCDCLLITISLTFYLFNSQTMWYAWIQTFKITDEHPIMS